jgi:ornithine decarboxylase
VPSLAEIGLAIGRAVAELPYPVALLAEPGRPLVAHAASAVATAIGRASRRGGEWIYLDIGVFSGVMEALEEGEAVRPPLVAPDSRGGAAAFTVAGPTCDQADTIARGVPLPADITVGDRVVLQSAGAYSLSYTEAFCGFGAPGVEVVDLTASLLRS